MKIITVNFGSNKFSNILTLIAGICLLIFPNFFVETVCYIAGAVCIYMALMKFITLYRTGLLTYMFFMPVITLIFGLILIYSHDSVIGLIPFVVGIYLVTGGISGIMMSGSLSSKKLILLVPSLLSLIFGLVLLFFPFKSAMIVLQVVGAALIYTSLQRFTALIFTPKSKQDNGPIEGEFEDIE